MRPTPDILSVGAVIAGQLPPDKDLQMEDSQQANVAETLLCATTVSTQDTPSRQNGSLGSRRGGVAKGVGHSRLSPRRPYRQDLRSLPLLCPPPPQPLSKKS